MIIGYVNTTVSLDQISEETLSDPEIRKKYSISDDEECGEIITRDSSKFRRQLKRTERDKPYLQEIDKICKSQLVNPSINRLFVATKPGDVVITSSMLNFSRYFEQTLKIARFFFEKQVRIIGLLEEYDSFADPLMESNLYFLFQEIRNNELANARKQDSDSNPDLILDGQKVRMSKQGRRSKKVNDYPLFAVYYKQWEDGIIYKAQFAERLNVSRPTLNKLIKEYEETHTQHLST